MFTFVRGTRFFKLKLPKNIFLKKYLDTIVSNAIRLQDKKFAFESVAFGHEQNVQIVLDYVIANSEDLVDA